MNFKEKIIRFLRWIEKYTETDMLYATYGSFWIIFGKIGIFLIILLKTLAFGRWIEPSVYGTYSFILSMAAIFAIFSLPGIDTALIKAIARKKEGTLLLALREKIKFSFLGSFASLILALWYFYNQNWILGSSFMIVTVLLPFYNSFNLFLSFWIGRKDFKKQSEYSFLVTALIALVMIPIIALTENVVWLILIMFLSSSLFSGILFLKTLKERKNNDVFLETIDFGKSLTLMGAINHFTFFLDKIILWKFFGPVQLAIYSFAQIPILQIQGAIPIFHLALPKIGEKETEEMKKGILKKFKKLFFISIPLAILAASISPYFYKIALPQYIDSIPYFQAFCILIALFPFTLLDTTLIAEVKKKELWILQTVVPISRIVLFITLIPLFGIWGIVTSIIISDLIGRMFSFYFFSKK